MTRGAALLLMTTLTAGCSSTAGRLGGAFMLVGGGITAVTAGSAVASGFDDSAEDARTGITAGLVLLGLGGLMALVGESLHESHDASMATASRGSGS